MLDSLSVPPLAVVAASTAAIYGFVLVLLRLLGRRELGQLSVIDLIVFLTLGSAVETAMIHGNTSLAAGLVSAGTLLVLNRCLTLIFLRSRRLRHLIGGGPILLVHDGRLIEEHLRRSGMNADDVAEALRTKGYGALSEVRYAVFETDGTVSVVPAGHSGADPGSAGPP